MKKSHIKLINRNHESFNPLKNIILLGLVFFSVISCQTSPEHTKSDLGQFVDPFIGTSGTGNTFPGATTPMGFVQVSPRTGNHASSYMSGYNFADTTIKGFAHTHLSGGGNPNLGDVLILPYSDDSQFINDKLQFSKKEEKASPGYYSTVLTDDKIKVELSATQRTGIHRYTFNEGGKYHILIDIDDVLRRQLGSPVKEAVFDIENGTTINGYLQSLVNNVDRKVYFTIHLSKAMTSSHFLDSPGNRRMVVDMEVDPGEKLEVRVGISTVGIDGAKLNLKTENTGKSFDEIREGAVKSWNSYLSKIRIEGTHDDKVKFYTSLYHLFVQPNNIADADGQYRGADDSIYVSPTKEMYSTFAFWDIYRGAFPLYTILIPDKIEVFVWSILRHADVKGNLPVWSLWGQDTRTMVGNHAVASIVEACQKGLCGENQERAFEAIEKTLTENWWGKYDWSLYDKYGYLPSDTVTSEAVSRTLEATYDDWCAAQLAKKLNKTKEYEFFSKRANYYKNLFDTSTFFMRGRNMDGSWVEPFNPILVTTSRGKGDYTEATAWQYVWHVQHDIPGLISLMGGKEHFESRLDTLFSMSSYVEGNYLFTPGMIGQYDHSNEPSHHVIYLYNYVGKPHKTQEFVYKVKKELYKNSTDGIPGNDDFGQLSAWYILSSLGFYPVNPASGIFDIGRPAFKYAKIQLGEKSFEIKTSNFADENIYVKSVYLNGKPVIDYKLAYSDIVKGGELLFEMTSSPNQYK